MSDILDKLEKFSKFKHLVDTGAFNWVDDVNDTNYPVILFEPSIELAVLVNSVKYQPETKSYIFQTSDGEYEVEARLLGSRFILVYYDDNVSYSEIEELIMNKPELESLKRTLDLQDKEYNNLVDKTATEVFSKFTIKYDAYKRQKIRDIISYSISVGMEYVSQKALTKRSNI